jgi:histidine triad (HIT) family protein
MTDDVFCKIIRGEIAGEFLYRDEMVGVIRDINPHAPTHLLVIPLKHIGGLDDIGERDEQLLGHLFRVAHQVAREQGLRNGYRLIVNEGSASAGRQETGSQTGHGRVTSEKCKAAVVAYD